MSDGSQMGQAASAGGFVLAELIVPFGAYALQRFALLLTHPHSQWHASYREDLLRER